MYLYLLTKILNKNIMCRIRIFALQIKGVEFNVEIILRSLLFKEKIKVIFRLEKRNNSNRGTSNLATWISFESRLTQFFNFIFRELTR